MEIVLEISLKKRFTFISVSDEVRAWATLRSESGHSVDLSVLSDRNGHNAAPSRTVWQTLSPQLKKINPNIKYLSLHRHL